MSDREKPKVSYRKKRHLRSPKIWKIEYLFNAMQEAVNLKHVIEKVADSQDADIQALPLGSVVVDPELLWYLSDTIEEMYGLLIREGLINSGNISKIQPTQH